MTYFKLFSKTLLSFCLLLAFYSTSVAQSVTHKQLSKEEVNKIFTTQQKENLGIDYPIYRVYTYWDMEGQSYLVLAENPSKTIDGKDASSEIQETHVRRENGKFIKISETNDHLQEEKFESSVWFWTKYIALDDYDGDQIADPIVAYGSAGINGFDDGRINFIIHYKGKKIMIEHQNGILDDERNTKVDEAFYILPNKIQNKVKEIMSNMEDKGQAIFPTGWIEAMGNKKTYFDEN
ncbi:hypothetical protein Fleli_1015 [Bernardetia litoralis DSM 6794]|uniref:Uncharacterized protein n=1 Tax=Bernardetia litoralis (strain ATCC 23117 / DSM 6794 / NBRC 15988 / NCIMB 1366 / Fx l1 / Sio-4) TaxID=880071 RepID=I4AHM7_BERLS|nr:hypothetical protein [Bernardetia litoralis]AFM03462.1 hypothetical protein Fleli_1015 [Bernardetia litoralis DSM 6794]